MVRKVKVTQEQADAIEWAISRDGRDYTHAELITEHSKKLSNWSGSVRALNELSLLTLVDALRIGYEAVPKYKVGDLVVLTEATLKKLEYLQQGVYEVHAVCKEAVCIEGPDDLEMPFDEVRHATPEEIKAEKERRVWKKIGRNVGEFIDGDRAVHKNGEIIVSADWMKTCYDAGCLKGIYPAESFIEFGGVDE